MKDTVTARKYAQALFSQATEKGEVLACQQGLNEIVRIIRVKDSLRGILVQPFIGLDEKKKLVHAALGEYNTPLLERFLNMLVEKHRFELLPLIMELFQELVDQSQNIQVARVKTAYAMNETQKQTLQSKLENFVGAKLRMEMTVDPELIGGIIVQLKDRLLDQSLGTQLRQLKDALSH